MSDRRAERTVTVIMRLLAAAFAIVGILFIAAPDAVIESIDDAGAALGDFAPAPETDQRLWLGLAFAYMVVIAGLALVVQADVARFRPLLLVLAAGKAASSLAAGAFFVFDDDVFVYLLNFVVDGSLVLVALGCWALAGRTEATPSGRAAAVPAPPVAGGSGPTLERSGAANAGAAPTPAPDSLQSGPPD